MKVRIRVSQLVSIRLMVFLLTALFIFSLTSTSHAISRRRLQTLLEAHPYSDKGVHMAATAGRGHKWSLCIPTLRGGFFTFVAWNSRVQSPVSDVRSRVHQTLWHSAERQSHDARN